MSKSKKPKPVSEFTEEQREWFRINKKYERKLQPFIGKSLLPGRPEHEKYKSIEQERESFEHDADLVIRTAVCKQLGQEPFMVIHGAP